MYMLIFDDCYFVYAFFIIFFLYLFNNFKRQSPYDYVMKDVPHQSPVLLVHLVYYQHILLMTLATTVY